MKRKKQICRVNVIADVKKIHKDVKLETYWFKYGDFHANEIAKLFRTFEKLGYSKFSFDIEEKYDNHEIVIIGEREETEAEFQKRLQDEQIRNRNQEERERAEYERLKARFEKE